MILRISPARNTYWLGFFVLVTLLSPSVHAQKKMTEVSHVLTVAHIDSGKSGDYVVVRFLESARIYKLPIKDNKHFSEQMHLLQQSEKKHESVKIRRFSEYADTILGVEPVRK
jgi:hypothetical protein